MGQVGLGLALGATIALSTGAAGAPPANPITREPAESSSESAYAALAQHVEPGCNGGADNGLKVDFTDALDALGAAPLAARRQLELGIEISNRTQFARPAVSYLAEVLDAHNTVVWSGQPAPAERLAQAQTRSGVAALPADLADGYYIARITAALSDGAQVTTSAAQRPFAVSAGRARLVSDAEFEEHSGWQYGVPSPEAEEVQP